MGKRLLEGDFDSNPPHVYTEIYSTDEALDEGSLHWFSPMLNIPGVASGRLIYKYKQGDKKHHFTLHAFDRYLEAIFDGGRWEVITDDGTRYEMVPAVISYRNPTNQRVQENTFTGYGGGALSELTMPKMEVISWYCTKIYNPNMTGSIDLVYETYGAFDYFKVLTEQDRMWDEISDEWLHPNAPGATYSKPQKVYRDIFLRMVKIRSGKVDPHYESISASGGSNMLEIGTPGVFRMDSLYN